MLFPNNYFFKTLDDMKDFFSFRFKSSDTKASRKYLESAGASRTLGKHAYSNILKILQPKDKIF